MNKNILKQFFVRDTNEEIFDCELLLDTIRHISVGNDTNNQHADLYQEYLQLKLKDCPNMPREGINKLIKDHEHFIGVKFALLDFLKTQVSRIKHNQRNCQSLFFSPSKTMIKLENIKNYIQCIEESKTREAFNYTLWIFGCDIDRLFPNRGLFSCGESIFKTNLDQFMQRNQLKM